MAVKSIKAVQRMVESNDPSIEIGQVWAARNANREIIRKIQIIAPVRQDLAPNDEKWWVVRELGSRTRVLVGDMIFLISEFNMRYVFSLHRRNNEHI